MVRGDYACIGGTGWGSRPPKMYGVDAHRPQNWDYGMGDSIVSLFLRTCKNKTFALLNGKLFVFDR